MKQLKMLIAAATLACGALSCQKSGFTDQKPATIAASKTNTALALSAAGSTSYVILCKNTSVSQDLLTQIANTGAVTASMPELGVVLANSANPDFATALGNRQDILSVTPDITLNWLDPAQPKAADDLLTAPPSQNAPAVTSAQIGLQGTNPFVPLQWSLQAVNAPAAFHAGYEGKGSVVAVLDGGFQLNNPDIAPNIISAVSFVPGEPAQFAGDPIAFSHATHVAGIIAAADNNVGTVGIAPQAKLMAVKVLNDEGHGAFGWMIQGVYYAASHGANIINMSLGGLIPRNGKFTDANGTTHDAAAAQALIIAMNRAFQFASKHDVLCIAAAGNDALNLVGQGQGTFYPASCTDVVSVSSTGPLGWGTDQTTSLYPFSFFSNYGNGFIDYTGPGGNLKYPLNTTSVIIGPLQMPAYVFDMVISPGSANGYYFAIGTSMASPAVSAVAALIAGKYQGNISRAQLQSKLKNSVVDLGAPGKDAYFGFGEVNAGLAIQQ
ncbi:MAG: S8 family serine peptidase [Niabella sp.]|nr:S8 family serine peptidase [Niabella sp.]